MQKRRRGDGPEAPFRGEPTREAPSGPVERGRRQLGDYLGNPERYRTRPSVQEVLETPHGPPRGGAVQIAEPPPGRRSVGVTPGSPRKLWDPEELQAVLAVAPTGRQWMPATWLIGSNTATRVDTGIRHRMAILLKNCSGQVIWIGRDSHINAAGNVGFPLAANAVQNGFNGESITLALSEEEQVWAVAAGGANNLLAVIELGR